MPVKKFRSVEEMSEAKSRRRLSPEEGLRIACEFSDLAYRLHPWHFEPGVRKFRSIEEAWEHRKEWQRRQVRRREP